MGQLGVIAEAFKEDNPVLLLIVLAMSIYVATKAIWNFVNEIQERKNAFLKGSLEIDNLSEDTKYAVKESLERVAFFRATGVSGDAYIRNLIANLLKATKGQFSIRGINRAKDYIDFENGELVISLSRWKTLSCWVSGIIGLASFVLAVTFFISATFFSLSGQPLSSYASLFFMCLIMCSCAVHSVMDVAAFLIAKDLDKFLKKHPECRGQKLAVTTKQVTELEEVAA